MIALNVSKHYNCKMNKSKINSEELISQTQRERLAYIDFRLYFLGALRRQDILDRFGVGPAVATRDITQYRSLYPKNIVFEGSTKTYLIGDEFKPAFEYNIDRVLTVLAHGFGDGINLVRGSLINCALPIALNHPLISILAPIARAINRKKAVSIQYSSHSSGANKREIVPHTIVNDGLRWHVRSFDRKSQEFRDFVLTRMESACVLESSIIEMHESVTQDNEWNRIVELELVPHPSRTRQEIIGSDYGMENGSLKIKIRAAIAGYFLRQWIVDCSSDHSLIGEEFRLWLKDSLVLYGVNNALLAPGYEKPVAG